MANFKLELGPILMKIISVKSNAVKNSSHTVICATEIELFENLPIWAPCYLNFKQENLRKWTMKIMWTMKTMATSNTR